MNQPITLVELQKIEFDILTKFASFCSENDLKYNLDSGTLIGAVRHKGFIPWDDDIDVTMPRPDYERFLHLTGGKLSEDVDVLTYKNMPNYIYPFAKAVNNKTILIENEVGDAHSIGVFLDIFPIDGLTDDDLKIKKLNRKRNLYVKMLFWSFGQIQKEKLSFKFILKTAVMYSCKIIGFRYFTKKLDILAQKYGFQTSEKVAQIIWGNKIFSMSKTGYLKNVPLEFEGMLFSVPSNYHEHLTLKYGDYLSIPPPEERKSHHQFKAFWKNDSKKPNLLLHS